MNPISPYSGVSFNGLGASIRPELPKPIQKPESVVGEIPSISKTGGKPEVGFENLLGTFVNEVNKKQMEALDTTQALLSGQNVPLHKAMLAMEEASVSFHLMLEVRNKLLEGYQELMRMQV